MNGGRELIGGHVDEVIPESLMHMLNMLFDGDKALEKCTPQHSDWKDSIAQDNCILCFRWPKADTKTHRTRSYRPPTDTLKATDRPSKFSRAHGHI